jgi:ribosomal protein S18 acetylase RimI-like enzyme
MNDTPAIRTAAPAGLSLRLTADADFDFLADVYASTRREELAPVPWPEEQKRAFLRWQFEAQHQYYREYYPHCEFLIVEKVNGGPPEPIGRLYVDRWPDQIRLVDIALLPNHRGQGFGGALLRSIIAEGAASGLPVTIHVEANNPAMALYRRLGFRHVNSNGIYYLMRWDASPSKQPRSPQSALRMK